MPEPETAYTDILFDVADGVATITIDRGDREWEKDGGLEELRVDNVMVGLRCAPGRPGAEVGP